MASTYFDASVTFHGVNEAGYSSGNGSITDGRDIAWLQDTTAQNAWGRWGVQYRDVVVLDGEGVVEGVINVTDYDLADPDNQDTLRGFVEAALSTL